MDSSTPFPGIRLATPGPPTGRLRTKGPPCHGGREIREAPPPSRRPGPRGAGEKTSPLAPFTFLCLHPHSLEPWRGETGPPCQHTGCLRVSRSAGTWHPACMDLVQSHLGAGGQNLKRPSSLPQRTHPTSGGFGDLPGSCLGAPRGLQAYIPTLGNAEPSPHVCVWLCLCIYTYVTLQEAT